ncbi:TRAP transporter large permease [Bacillus sp. DTU_2020_1000418_1_SI_GHA_SEK_038]|uniref:TRAP transporter large permease n=1 Tax=Bacillus sp. DTU_2020_1000418_1_SI_GHA_SEK_038 TaxID=3077585 RepID=UPI0028EC0B21|nr:TRAP transporter large permease [Bacillus sp. DTU_2020_1000418_1_SI_GHA_SEK_038]WNS76560.1 TRAP transporter large permease [Bacillus sp. DTU_2020_1000418_1_SI_GHA_SEK_038]
MILFLMILIFFFLFSSTPIFVALTISSFFTILFLTDIQPMILIQRLFGGIDQFALMALPFFIFAANIMEVGGLSKRILRWARGLVGHLSGGVAMTTQISSMFFGALSGSSPATVVAIGKIMYPEMIRGKYNKGFAAALLASSGAVSLIIPPSITLIIFGSVTGVSVGSLFIAGIGAGIIFGLSSIVYIYIYARKNNIPRDKKASAGELWDATKKAAWALMIPVIILGGIYGGIFTPTEAAGVSAVYALLISLFVYKEMDMKSLYRVCVDSAVLSAQVLVLVAAAQVLGWMLTRGQVPQAIATWITTNVETSFMFLMVLNVVLLILGMFMEGVAAIIIVAPLIFPTAVSMGIDPVHLGVIIITNLAIGMYTPPFGLNLFVTQGITNLKIPEMMPGILRFLAFNIIGLLIITYIPEASLFLLNIME